MLNRGQKRKHGCSKDAYRTDVFMNDCIPTLLFKKLIMAVHGAEDRTLAELPRNTLATKADIINKRI